MKRLSTYLCTFLLLAGALSATDTKLVLTVHGNYLQLAKNNYTVQSGLRKLFAEAKIAIPFYQNMYAWASYGSLPVHDNQTEWSGKNSYDKDIYVDRTLTKRIYSAGVGYFVGYFRPNQFTIKLELGLCHIANTIDSELLDLTSRQPVGARTAKQAGTGFRVNLGGTYGLFWKVFAEAEVGLLSAGKSLLGVRSNLGGLHLSTGLGVRF